MKLILNVAHLQFNVVRFMQFLLSNIIFHNNIS